MRCPRMPTKHAVSGCWQAGERRPGLPGRWEWKTSARRPATSASGRGAHGQLPRSNSRWCSGVINSVSQITSTAGWAGRKPARAPEARGGAGAGRWRFMPVPQSVPLAVCLSLADRLCWEEAGRPEGTHGLLVPYRRIVVYQPCSSWSLPPQGSMVLRGLRVLTATRLPRITPRTAWGRKEQTMKHPLWWCVGLLGLLVPVMSAATTSRLDLGMCPAWTARVERCACPCACVPVPGELSGHGRWWQGLDGSSLLASWLALGRLAVPLGVGGLLLGLLGIAARAAGRRGVSPAPAVRPGGRWARTAAACRGCGETTRRHHAHGLCRRCYARQRGR
jgi:hypothetical protein